MTNALIRISRRRGRSWIISVFTKTKSCAQKLKEDAKEHIFATSTLAREKHAEISIFALKDTTTNESASIFTSVILAMIVNSRINVSSFMWRTWIISTLQFLEERWINNLERITNLTKDIAISRRCNFFRNTIENDLFTKTCLVLSKFITIICLVFLHLLHHNTKHC